MIRKSVLGVVPVAVAAVASSLFFVSNPAEGAPVPTTAVLQAQVDTGGTVSVCHCTIPLTSTLRLTTNGTRIMGDDTTFVWNGPPGQPMIVFNGAMFNEITGVNLVAGSSRPSTGIEFRNAPIGRAGHPTFGNRLNRIRIGVRGNTTMDYGVTFTGDVNGDSNSLENIQISGAGVAGVAMLNPQAVANDFDGLWVFDSPIGFQARAKDSAGNAYGPYKLQGRNWGFGNISVADIDVGPNAAVDVTGFYSEGGRRMVNSSGGGVSVRHGYWQRGANAAPLAEGTLRNNNTGGYRSWIRLEDFDFTNGGSERIVGWPASQQILSNVAGITSA